MARNNRKALVALLAAALAMFALAFIAKAQMEPTRIPTATATDTPAVHVTVDTTSGAMPWRR